MPTELIIALDFDSSDEALNFLRKIDAQECIVKVGFELFVAAGPAFVKMLVNMGYRVFLDLKFNDIPNTVAKACVAAAELGVWMINVHASGGSEMLKKSKQALRAFDQPPILIAVTVLTSMDDAQLKAVNVAQTAVDQVRDLALLAQQCELDGVVCSAQEAQLIRQHCGTQFVTVTPGIRLADDSNDDQKRVATPAAAKADGVSYIVVGRPITQAEHPQQVIDAVLADLKA